MPLSHIETTIYTKMFKESPSLTEDTMGMENVVKLCRDLGWSERDFSTRTIQRLSKNDGPLNCDDFLKMFETQSEKAVRKAKYTRDFANMDKDSNGKITSIDLAKYINADEDNAKDVLDYADQDGDKLLDLNEFLAMLLP